jgi:CRISPR type III-A-associated RAMP protein Csm4
MALYSAIFKPLGPMTKIPDSQVLFGAFCHAYKSIYGETELEKMLHKQSTKPYFFLSSFFPQDFLPMPIGLQFERFKDINEVNHGVFKLSKKIKYISIGIYNDLQSNPQEFLKNFYQRIINEDYFFSGENLFLQKKSEAKIPNRIFYKEMRIRNSKQGEEKQLFYNYVTYVHPSMMFQAYIRIEDDSEVEKIKNVFTSMRYLSLGGNKSVGYNLFDIVKLDQINEFENKLGVKLLLSKSVGDEYVDLSKSTYQLKVFHNKFNGISPTRHRKTVIGFLEGSLLSTEKFYSGSLIEDTINGKKIYQNFIGLLF